MSTYNITGMTCNNCANKVAATLKLLADDVQVTLKPPRVMTSSNVSMAQINTALAGVGKYQVSELTVQPNPVLNWLKTYFPLLLILGLIGLAALAGQSWMMASMAGFYIVFGAFKLLDLPGFATTYAGYDVIAKNFKAWAYAYPFIEIALGFAFLFWWRMDITPWIALGLSLVGGIGVIQATLSKRKIQCACLGTVLKLPMSVVTIIENLGMAAMAAWMLWFGM